MGQTCLSVFALGCILLTFVAIAISFSCPEWLYQNPNTPENQKPEPMSKGLWLRCDVNSASIRWELCEWYFANNFELQNNKDIIPPWFLAVQVLYSVALGFCVLAVLAATCTCLCKSNRANSVTCGLINFTFLLLVAAVATFGAMSYTETSVRVSGSNVIFGWVFWVAVGSTGMALLSTILYYCLSRVEDYAGGYKD